MTKPQKVINFFCGEGLAPLLVAAFLGCFLGVCLPHIKNSGWGSFEAGDIWLCLVIFSIAYICAIMLLKLVKASGCAKRSAATRMDDGAQTYAQTDRVFTIGITKVSLKISLKMTFVFAAIIFICWLPVLLAYFPGILFNDTVFQLIQYFGDPFYGHFSMHEGTSFTDHHPIFTTFVFGVIVDAGMFVFGSANAGLFTLVVIQSVCMAFTFAFSCAYLKAIAAPRPVYVVVLVVYCLIPLYSWTAAAIAKDTMFSWLLVWFVLILFEIVRSRGLALSKPLITAGFVLDCLLLAMSRKSGIYVVLITCLFLLLFYRKYLLQLLLAAVLPAATIFVLFPLIIFPALNISVGSPVEAIGILYQQTARYVIDYPEDVTKEEKEIIDELIGYDTLAKRYNPWLIDPIKGYGFLDGVEPWPTGEQLQRYIAVYLAQGMRHPDAYMRAFFALESVWFYPHTFYDGTFYNTSVNGWNLVGDWLQNSAASERLSFEVPENFTANPINDIEKALGYIPIVLVYYMPLFHLLLVPLAAFLLFMGGRGQVGRRYVLVLVPAATLFLFVLISPAPGVNQEAFRYVLPFIFTTPLLFALALRVGLTYNNSK